MSDDRFSSRVDMSLRCVGCRTLLDPGLECTRMYQKCYACWQAYLSAGHRRAHEELERVAKLLRSMPHISRELGRFHVRGGAALRGEAAEVYSDAKAVLDGPFGGSMNIILSGWNSVPEASAKPRGRLED